MNKQKTSSGVFYRRLIFLIIVVVAIITCICATYITEYNKNVMNPQKAFADKDVTNLTEVSQAEFLNCFSTFEIYATEMIDPIFEGKELLQSGRMKFAIETKLAEETNFKGTTFKITAKLGASWIGYTSNSSSTITVTVGKKSTALTISNIDKYFPCNGNLWFTSVKHPTLYLYVQWTNTDGQSCYTFLTYNYSSFSVAPKA